MSAILLEKSIVFSKIILNGEIIANDTLSNVLIITY